MIDNMEVEDQDLIDDEESDATYNDPTPGATGDSSDNAASISNQSSFYYRFCYLFVNVGNGDGGEESRRYQTQNHTTSIPATSAHSDSSSEYVRPLLPLPSGQYSTVL